MPSLKRQVKLDKFIVKKSSPPIRRFMTIPTNKIMKKQPTITSLKGFIDVNDIDNALAVFRDPNTNTFRLQIIIEKFIHKIPTRSILENTDILPLMKNLHNTHEDSEVKKLAGLLYDNWNSHLETFKINSKKPLIDVSCDARTTLIRDKARLKLKATLNTYFTCTLDMEIDPEDPQLQNLAEMIEKPVFYKLHSVDWRYKPNVKAACRIIEKFSPDLFKKSLPLELPADLWQKFQQENLIPEKWNF